MTRGTMRALEISIWAASVSLLPIGALAVAPKEKGAAEVRPTIFTAISRATVELDGDTLFATADRTGEASPFRIDRRPADVEYQPDVVEPRSAAPPSPPPPLRPSLALAGLIGGPPWQALIEGFPDHPEAVLLRQGERVGPFRLRSVRADGVTIEGADTLWNLKLKERWQ